MAHTLDERLDEGLAALRLDDTWAERHLDAVGVSELGRCPRAAWLRLHRIEATNIPPVGDDYPMKMGALKHERIMDLLDIPAGDRNIAVSAEIEGLPLVGHVDFRLDGRLVELKTTSVGGVTRPRFADEVQANGYLLATGQPIDLWYRLDNGGRALFAYDEPEDRLVEEIEWRCRKIATATEPGQVPCDFAYCDDCPWRDLCAGFETPEGSSDKAVAVGDLEPPEQRLLDQAVVAHFTKRDADRRCKELDGRVRGILEARGAWAVETSEATVKRVRRAQSRLDTKKVKQMLGEDTPMVESVSEYVDVRPLKGEENGKD
jgi:hypothetical protein